MFKIRKFKKKCSKINESKTIYHNRNRTYIKIAKLYCSKTIKKK